FGSQFRLGPRNFRRSDGEHEELRRRATRIQESGRGGAAAGGHALPLGERLLVAEHVGCGNGAVSRRTRKRSLELHGAVENREHHSGAARRFVPSVGGSPKSSGCVSESDGSARWRARNATCRVTRGRPCVQTSSQNTFDSLPRVEISRESRLHWRGVSGTEWVPVRAAQRSYSALALSPSPCL